MIDNSTSVSGHSRHDLLRDELFRHVEEITGLGAWTWDPGSGLSSWSDQVFRILGLDPSTPMTTELYLSMVPPEERELVAQITRAGVRGQGYAADHRIVRPDGSVRVVETRGRGEYGPDGVLRYALGTISDVTEVRAAAADLRRARDLFAGVLDATTEQSIIGLDAHGKVTVFNAGAERMLEYSAAEMIGVPVPPELHDNAEVEARAAELGVEPSLAVIIGRAAQGMPETRQWTYVTKSGRRLQVIINATAMFGPAGEITGFIKVGTDITARVAAEQALAATEKLFEQVFDRAPSGILLAAVSEPAKGQILRVNPALCRITGYTEDQLLGMTVAELVHPQHADAYLISLESFGSNQVEVADAERQWVNADGRDIWVQINASRANHNRRDLIIAMVEDITARKDAEQRLSHLALHDALTGLPNRTLLLDRLEHELAAERRSGSHVAVVYLDLDGFKSVNDEFGHLAGDEVLLMVAKRLSEHVRPGDTVARLGGDEFVALCPDLTNDNDAQALATRLLNLIAEPYARGQLVHHLSASIGVAVSAADSTAQGLLREADDAMYTAKEGGKNRVHRSGNVDPNSLTRTARAARHVLLETELRSALDRHELVMHGQPLIDLRTGEVMGVETLIRWQHPTRGLLTPVDFLDVAENSTLMGRIGRRVLDESCRIATLLTPPAGSERRAPVVYVNISGRQLESGQLHDDVLFALNSVRLPANRLVLEFTETFTPLVAGSLLEDLDDLRRLGVRLAIDDVGTGYSSLARLTELPVDILKIDRSFVGRMGQSRTIDAVVRAILNIGQSLRLQVVAEGVETAEQQRLLSELGCDTAQGFHFSRPLPEAELVALLTASPVPAAG